MGFCLTWQRNERGAEKPPDNKENTHGRNQETRENAPQGDEKRDGKNAHAQRDAQRQKVTEGAEMPLCPHCSFIGKNSHSLKIHITKAHGG